MGMAKPLIQNGKPVIIRGRPSMMAVRVAVGKASQPHAASAQDVNPPSGIIVATHNATEPTRSRS
jgi:hypothetical protein